MPVQNARRELEKNWFGKKWIGIANKYLLQLQHPLCHVSDSAVTQEFKAFYHFLKRLTYSFERLKAIQKALKASLLLKTLPKKRCFWKKWSLEGKIIKRDIIPHNRFGIWDKALESMLWIEMFIWIASSLGSQ